MKIVKDPKKWEETKEKIKKELTNPFFWTYILFITLFAIIFVKVNIPLIKTIALLGLIIFQLTYNLKTWNKDLKIFNWIIFAVFILYFIMYVSMKMGEINTTLISLIIFFLIVVGGGIIISFINLKKSRTIFGIILNYIIFSAVIILLFSLIFTMTTNVQENQILDSDGKKIISSTEYIWYSIGNFYNINFGETPYGVSKSISYFEIAFSFIFHLGIFEWILRKRT